MEVIEKILDSFRFFEGIVQGVSEGIHEFFHRGIKQFWEAPVEEILYKFLKENYMDKSLELAFLKKLFKNFW